MKKAITIYLGSRCNLNCKYCHRECDSTETGVSESLLRYIKENKIDKISFIGGEPTLYMNDIKKVVEANPMAEFKVTTNGVDIKKHLPFFLYHRFLVCISYDGKNDLRGYDPFTEVIKYPYLAVSCTLYHGNTDFSAIFKSFAEKERIIGRFLSFYPHIMHYTSESNKAYKLNYDDYDNIIKQYKTCIEKYIYNAVNYACDTVRYRGMFHQLYDRYKNPYDFGETYCANKHTRKCNANGDMFSCLYIRNQKPEELTDYIKEKYPKCQKCPVYDMCGSACIKSLDHEGECYFYHKLYSWFKEYIKPYENVRFM